MKRDILTQLNQDRADKRAVALVTRLADGQQTLVYPDGRTVGELSIPESGTSEVSHLLSQGRSAKLTGFDAQDELFVRSYVQPYRLILVGAVHIAQCLAPMAKAAGYEVIIIDPRRGFASTERFADLEVICDWPDDALLDLAPDRQTALVTLTHDPKIDDVALIFALRSEAFYIGALGSQRTHTGRLERLEDAGLGDVANRICGPIGLSIGGKAPAEIAVAILAQIIQHRYQRFEL